VTKGDPSDTHGQTLGRAAGAPEGEPAARLADVCARRGAVYQALALGLGDPTPAYCEALRSGELHDGLRAAVAWLGDDAAVYETAFQALSQTGSAMVDADPAVALRDLRVEHARLFTGPGTPAVRCYASQYLDADPRRPSRLNRAAAAFATTAYAAEGAAPVAELGELPDHVTIELEFLFSLCRREEDAWDEGATDEALRLRRALDAFLREHAGLWLPEFAAAVGAATTSGLYRALSDLLVAHLSVELGEGSLADDGDAAG